MASTMPTDFHGDRLRLVRQFHGLSLTDLGNKVSASRQYLHQLESGAKRPTGEMRAALAHVLAVEPSFFSTPLINPIREEQTHFRKLRATAVNVTQEVLSYGTMFESLIALLDELLDLPPVDFPEIPVRTDADVERAADTCRIHWGLGASGPIGSMTRVIENAGAIVAIFDTISEKVDALSIGRARPIVMRNPVKESLFRQRWDLAHECGHLVMHQGITTGDRLTESQAHRFAGAFLLPRPAFEREFPRRSRLDWQAIFGLKLRWKVSAAAIVRRAYDLGLLNAVQYRKANIHLANTGQKKIEKFDRDFPTERPELLRKCLDVLSQGGGESISTLAVRLGVKPALVNRLIAYVYEEEQTTADPLALGNVLPFPSR